MIHPGRVKLIMVLRQSSVKWTHQECNLLNMQQYMLTIRAYLNLDREEHIRLVWYNTAIFFLKGWRGNCDIKLLLYYSDPSCPDISEIKDVCRYVVSYTGKRHNTSQTEKDAIQNIIMG